MSVRIRLTRTGRKNLPAYRIAVFDTHTRRDGPALEVVGWFNPLSREAGKGFKVQSDRLEHWIGKGAVMTLAVTQLLDRQGVKLALPAKAPPAAPGVPAAAKKPAAPARKHVPVKLDDAAKARRKNRIEKRAARRATRAKKAAAKAAAARPAPAKAPAGGKA